MANDSRFSRRELLGSAAALGSVLNLADVPAKAQPLQSGAVNKNSAPSQLRTTDKLNEEV